MLGLGKAIHQVLPQSRDSLAQRFVSLSGYCASAVRRLAFWML
jgi:hypothetical protein